MVTKLQYFSHSYLIFGEFLFDVFYLPVQTHYSWPPLFTVIVMCLGGGVGGVRGLE